MGLHVLFFWQGPNMVDGSNDSEHGNGNGGGEDVRGTVKWFNISKGFGFVEMALDHEAEIAIKALHGSKLGKHKIRVKAAS